MTDAEALAKFSACMAAGLGVDESTIGQLAQTILTMDTLIDVAEVIRQFPKAS